VRQQQARAGGYAAGAVTYGKARQQAAKQEQRSIGRPEAGAANDKEEEI